LFLPDAQTLLGGEAVDGSLDVEQEIDALDRLKRDRRDRRRGFAAPCIGGDVGQLEELPPGVSPAQCRRDRPLRTRRIKEAIVSAIGVCLQDAGEVPKMALGMLLPPIARGIVEGRRRRGCAERPVVADIMRWTASTTPPIMPNGQVAKTRESIMTVVRIGLDTSKSWFQVHGVDEDGEPVLRRKLARSKVLTFFANLPPCTVGLEACGGAHYWARELAKLGHAPRLMPARYVRPYVKTNKHDAADAEACCEAVQRPGMRFVPPKTVEQQSMLMVHRVRELLIRQRAAAVNALRGHLSEFGIVRPKGTAKARELMDLVAVDDRIPALARDALQSLVRQIRDTEQKIAAFNGQILAMAKENDTCRRLMSVLTIGPFASTALLATVGDPHYFSSGRHFAAWLGLVPKQHSTAGKERLGGISKRGDSYVRKLLIHGARATVHNIRSGRVKGAWITGLLARRHFNVATVALANKTARIAWAVMTTGQSYRAAI